MRAMITIHFDTRHRKEMSALVPQEQEHVRTLMRKGTLEGMKQKIGSVNTTS